MTEATTDNSQQDFQDLKKKSLKGMSALFVRQVLVKVIFFAGNIILARLLAPQIFGIYAIVQFVVQFFSTFGDVGIGAALIQKKGELSQEELSTTFWLQQMLVWLVVGVVVLVAPLALKVYPTLPPVGVWLIRAMALSFLFSSLKTIPAILMERNIDFNRIAWVDITENLAYQGVAITGAYLGYGAWSFVAAAITRAFLGAGLIYALSSWRPSFHYRFESAKGLVRFGVPYQGNYILSFIKDAVTPLFVGAYAGAAAVGYVNWARNFAFAPLIISETFGRVAFPAFSQLQDSKELLGRTIERSIRMMTLILFPVTFIMIALAPEITHVIFTDKWAPGLNAFYLYAVAIGGIGIFLPLSTGVLSIGNSKILLKISVFLLISEWVMAVPFVIYFGFNGVALTQPILAFACTLVYRKIVLDNGICVRVISNVYKQLIASFLVLGVLYFFRDVSATLMELSLHVFVGGVIYVISVYVLDKNMLNEIGQYCLMARSKGVKQ
ncbi:MAG: oligosaccharide flippase family protein [Desulfuromonadaceae bacterium]|nr:oligosaccharide flippase family protein [Desulfuromonadaceae bacterium]